MSARLSIDLNCDLGEFDTPADFARDDALLSLVSSASIACGGHAGDASTMVRTIGAALASGVVIGAHPSYPDRAGFGRAAVELSPAQLADCVARQIDALLQITLRQGGTVRYVKPHGALYHDSMQRPEIAAVFAQAVARVDGRLALLGLAGSPGVEFWRSRGVVTAREAFADRAYGSDGWLVPRGAPGAVIADPHVAARRAVRIACGEPIESAAGELLHIRAESVCVHGDSPRSVEIAAAVREGLEYAGVAVRAWVGRTR